MSGTSSTTWFFSDWMSDPGVRACSLAAKGLWKDMLCIAGMNHGRDRGYVLIGGRVPTTTDLARLVGATPDEVEICLSELERNQVFNRDRRGAIYCRRMVRAEKNRKNGKLGGSPKHKKNKENKKSVGQNTYPHIPIPDSIESSPSDSTPHESLFDDREVDVSEHATKAVSADDWPPDFVDQFWKAYPPQRRTEKTKVAAKLAALRRTRTATWAQIMAGLLRYSASRDVARGFAKGPMPWLNGGCWQDEFTEFTGDDRLRGTGRGGRVTFADIAMGRTDEQAH